MSSTQTVINPQTALGEGTFDASPYHSVTLFASNLAGAEEVDVLLGGGNVEVIATDSAGAPLKLTATVPSAVVPGGPLYVLRKDATAGQSGVYAAPALP